MFENINILQGVRRECGKVILNALPVADIDENTVKNGDPAALRSRNHQTAHCHCRQQADCFQRDRFTACVRACDDERVIIAAEMQRDRHDSFGVNQRMPRFLQFQRAVLCNLRDHALLHRAE